LECLGLFGVGEVIHMNRVVGRVIRIILMCDSK